MEFLGVLSQALFLGLSGIGMPLTIITYCVLSSIRNSGKIGGFLFSGHLSVQIILTVALLFSADLLIESPVTQIILNLINFLFCALFGAKLAISAVKNEQFLRPSGNNDSLNKNYNTKNKQNNKGGAVAFLLSFVFTITNTNWLLWFDISAKSLLLKSYILCGTSISGIFGAIIFVVAFLFAECIFYIFVSKLSAFIGRLLNDTLLRVLIALSSLSFTLSAFFSLADIIRSVLLL